MVASAPNSRSLPGTCALRPAATTRAAPNRFAICTASCPATPVAPRIRTVSPGTSRARCVSESQADMPGLGRAAATKVSRPSGNGMHRAWSTTVRSAIAPNGTRGPAKNTRVPSWRRPTPSSPHTTGSLRGGGVVSAGGNRLVHGLEGGGQNFEDQLPSPATGSENGSQRGICPSSCRTAAFTVRSRCSFYATPWISQVTSSRPAR